MPLIDTDHEPSLEDARATVRSVIHGAIAETSVQTGLRAGPASTALLDAIMREIESPSTKWAFLALSK